MTPEPNGAGRPAHVLAALALALAALAVAAPTATANCDNYGNQVAIGSTQNCTMTYNYCDGGAGAGSGAGAGAGGGVDAEAGASASANAGTSTNCCGSECGNGRADARDGGAGADEIDLRDRLPQASMPAPPAPQVPRTDPSGLVRSLL